jgi:hypothetical protein
MKQVALLAIMTPARLRPFTCDLDAYFACCTCGHGAAAA